jgi:hypothetical protein
MNENPYTMTNAELETYYRKVWDSRDPDEESSSEHVRMWQLELDELELEMGERGMVR